jgi:hypothetical protein
MKIKIIDPCILFSICLISFSAGAVDFLGDLSQAIGDVSKSTGDIAQSIKDVSKDTPATSSKASPIVITEIPNQFQGKWVTNQNNCVGNPDSGVVDIEKNRFYGYEWSSYIKSTELIGNKLEVVFTTSSDGGESPEASKQSWELNNAGNTLSISDAAGGVEKYSRCGSSSLATVIPESVNKEVIFSCATKKGKIISLTKFGNTIEYSFGFPNKKPELVIDTPEDNVIYQYGSGRTIAATFDKGALNYTVGYVETNKKIEDHYVFINGVIISNKTSYKTIAQVECVSSETEEYQDKLESYIIKKQ